jgi:hypothetical protein
MQKPNLLLLVFFVCILIGCARSSVTRIGSETFPPLLETANVFVYSNQSEVRRPFVAIGIVSYTDPGKYQVLT